MANGFYPYPPPVAAPAPTPAPAPDNKGNRQRGNKKDKKDKKDKTTPKEKTGTPNTNLPRTSLSRPSKLHFYCHFHGWVTTHGWPSGNGGHHGDPCQFMKSRLSEFTAPMLAARTQPPRLHQCPACRQCAPLPLCPVHSPTWSRLALTFPYYNTTLSRSNQAPPKLPV